MTPAPIAAAEINSTNLYETTTGLPHLYQVWERGGALPAASAATVSLSSPSRPMSATGCCKCTKA
jgi:hypothetical protein